MCIMMVIGPGSSKELEQVTSDFSECDLYGPSSGVGVPDSVGPPDGVGAPDHICRPLIVFPWAELVPGQVLQVGVLQPISWDSLELDCWYPYDIRIDTTLPDLLGIHVELGVKIRSIKQSAEALGIGMPGGTGAECIMVVWDKWVNDEPITGQVGMSASADGYVAGLAWGGWGNPRHENLDTVVGAWNTFHMMSEISYTFDPDANPDQQKVANVDKNIDCNPPGLIIPWACYYVNPPEDTGVEQMGMPFLWGKGWFLGRDPFCMKWGCIKWAFVPVTLVDIQVWGAGSVSESANECSITHSHIWGKSITWFASVCTNKRQ